jgi:drug/metabolite transporter (DMT)-like permease
VETPARVTSRGWSLFAAMSLIWGIPYLFIKLAVDGGMPPALVAWGRVALAAVVLLPIAWRVGALRGMRSRWRAAAAFGLVEIVVPFPLIAAGEQHVSSSLAAILIATVPLVVAVLAIRLDPDERVSGGRLLGLVVGLVGVVVLLGIDVAGRPDELLGALMIGVAAVGYAIGPFIVTRWLSGVHSLGPVTVALWVSAIALAPLAILSAPGAAPTAGAIGSVVVLGIICSAAAFVVFFALIAEAGPGRATVITYINPVIALVLGVLLIGETVGTATLVGLGLILAGSWLATRRAGGIAGEIAGDGEAGAVLER